VDILPPYKESYSLLYSKSDGKARRKERLSGDVGGIRKVEVEVKVEWRGWRLEERLRLRLRLSGEVGG
jgi:hypothetical protein